MKKFAVFLLSYLILTFAVSTSVYYLTRRGGNSVKAEIGTYKPKLNLVPFPHSIKLRPGMTLLSDKNFIHTPAMELLPLAKVLSDELYQLTGVRLDVVLSGLSEEGIHFEADPSLREEAYHLDVEEKVVIRGGSYGALAMGSISLLHLAEAQQGKVVLPRLSIRDFPHAEYRGLMVDLARNWHEVETIKQLITLCRWYKIRCLQLHLTDDQSFTFPTKAYPELLTLDRHYTVEQLEELERFAAERGIFLVPEMDVPGHSTKMREVEPFGLPGLNVINMASEKVYEALDTIIGEMCRVFASSPYFHIGADECWLVNVGKTFDEQDFMEAQGIANAEELFNYFIVRMNEIVKKHGKKTLIWEGFEGTGSENVRIPDDITVTAWETLYQPPGSLLCNGYTIVNSSWKPIYVTKGRRWDSEYIYGWNMWRWENFLKSAPSYMPIQLERNSKVIGAQMSAWEMEDEMEVPSLRARLPAMSERIWNPDAGRGYADFRRRFLQTDLKFETLIFPVQVQAEGLLNPDYEGPFYNRENWFDSALTLTLKPLIKDAQVHYTLDGSLPTLDSPEYSGPVSLTDTTTVKAAVFDREGRMLGYRSRTYECWPIKVKTQGHLVTLEEEVYWKPIQYFSGTLVFQLESAVMNGQIRYTLDGSDPTINTPLYRNPFSISESATVKAQFFTVFGEKRGMMWEQKYVEVNYQDNIALGKPVTASERKPGYPPEVVVDGVVDFINYWSAGGETSAWLTIDLQKVVRLNRIQVFPYWGGWRYNPYVIEVSTDDKHWTRVADMSASIMPATTRGFLHKFPPRNARYIRIASEKHPTNYLFRLVEVRAFEAE